jgi:phosphoribosylamine--glycine ligase
MVVVQDHKRAGEGDTGPNTGGMGSYSCEDHRLPFLLPGHVAEASAINAAVARALRKETGQKYKGILYGGFIATRDGIRLLEYNARFGDPETMNVLSVLETDFVDICEAIIEEKLHELPIKFQRKATVCKYVVPEGYPETPVKGARIDLSAVPKESPSFRMYKAAVVERDGELFMTGSRAIAFVGIGGTLADAERIAEQAASSVKGPVFHRRDIGTPDLIQKRLTHMKHLAMVK